MSEFVWLEEPLHKNAFGKFNWEEHPEILDTLMISVDGSIMAVRLDKVEEHYANEGVQNIRMGYKKAEKWPKIEGLDTIYKVLAHYVEL
jgi:hypothetical protein